MKQTAVEWLIQQIEKDSDIIFYDRNLHPYQEYIEQAKEMEKEQMLDFGDFIIDELEPMAQNREWVEERYNYFKSE
jgi:predicted adenine nucleotide alpha hydrolase (AANH) superfamily ATPase